MNRRAAVILVLVAALAGCGRVGEELGSAAPGAPERASTATSRTSSVPSTVAPPTSTTAVPDAAPGTAPPAAPPPPAGEPVGPDPVPTTAAPAAPVVPDVSGAQTSGNDASSVVRAFSTLVDLDAPFEAKAPHLQDAEALRPALEEYARRVRPFASQIGVRLATVTVEGDRAAFGYDLVAPDGRVLLPGLSGEATRIDGTWVVPRASFCTTMARIGIGCPP